MRADVQIHTQRAGNFGNRIKDDGVAGKESRTPANLQNNWYHKRQANSYEESRCSGGKRISGQKKKRYGAAGSHIQMEP